MRDRSNHMIWMLLCAACAHTGFDLNAGFVVIFVGVVAQTEWCVIRHFGITEQSAREREHSKYIHYVYVFVYIVAPKRLQRFCRRRYIRYIDKIENEERIFECYRAFIATSIHTWSMLTTSEIIFKSNVSLCFETIEMCMPNDRFRARPTHQFLILFHFICVWVLLFFTLRLHRFDDLIYVCLYTVHRRI